MYSTLNHNSSKMSDSFYSDNDSLESYYVTRTNQVNTSLAYKHLATDDLKRKVFTPNLSISENNKAILVTAKLPGIQLEDISMSLLGCYLVIYGDKNIRYPDELFIEEHPRRYDSFKGTVFIPNIDDVNQEKITAEINNGILKIILPKN